jgi:hypothetical protein
MELYRDPSEHAITLSGQLTQVVFNVVVKLVAAAYTAKFAAVLVLANTADTIQDLMDIPKNAPVGTMCGWALETWLRENGFTNIVCYQSTGKDTSISMARQIESGLVNKRYVAFFMTETAASVFTKVTNCRLQGVGQAYEVLPIAFQFNKQVPAFVKKELNSAIIKAWDNGLLESLDVTHYQTFPIGYCGANFSFSLSPRSALNSPNMWWPQLAKQ